MPVLPHPLRNLEASTNLVSDYSLILEYFSKVKINPGITAVILDEAGYFEMVDNQNFSKQFHLFAKFGDRDSDGRTIKLSQSDKWMRQAKVIDGKKITSTDTAICFKKFKLPKLTETEYTTFLEDLGKTKGIDVGEMKTMLASCGAPGFTSAVNNVKTTGAVERLTDPSKYTGSHKERFDVSGKGKGLAGRRDEVDTSGYVAGYSNKDTYNKEHGTSF